MLREEWRRCYYDDLCWECMSSKTLMCLVIRITDTLTRDKREAPARVKLTDRQTEVQTVGGIIYKCQCGDDGNESRRG